jgi:hypothetical protein
MRAVTFVFIGTAWLLCSSDAFSSEKAGLGKSLRQFIGMGTLCINKSDLQEIDSANKAGKDGHAVFLSKNGCDTACINANPVHLIDAYRGPGNIPYESYEAIIANGEKVYITVSVPQLVSDEVFDAMTHDPCTTQ